MLKYFKFFFFCSIFSKDGIDKAWYRVVVHTLRCLVFVLFSLWWRVFVAGVFLEVVYIILFPVREVYYLKTALLGNKVVLQIGACHTLIDLVAHGMWFIAVIIAIYV
jgi:hypothetical protein